MDKDSKPPRRGAAQKPATPADDRSETQPIKDGGTEDLMVQGHGGTLPLKGFDKPDYYSKSRKKP